MSTVSENQRSMMSTAVPPLDDNLIYIPQPPIYPFPTSFFKLPQTVSTIVPLRVLHATFWCCALE